MSTEEQEKQLLFRILQESDDDDEDEIDKIISNNLQKSQDKVKLDIPSTNQSQYRDVPSMSAGDAEDFKETPAYKKFTFPAQNARNKRDVLDSVLRDLGIDNDSSDEDDDLDMDNDQLKKMIDRDVKKKKYEQNLNNELNIDFSDDSDDEIDTTGNLRTKLDEEQRRKEEEEDKRLIEQTNKMTLLEIVEQNERKSEEMARAKHQNSFSLFSYDKNYYNIHKIEKKLMDQQRLTRIADYIYNPMQEEYKGLPYCIKQYKNLIFVGISQGVIRIFDYNTNDELKPLILKKKHATINRVLCMDISLHGEYLIAGYAEGNLALFDLNKMKCMVEINEVHFHEIDSVKFLSLDSPIMFISADRKGVLYKVTVSRSMIMYSTKTELIMKKPFRDFCAIAALQPIPGMPSEVGDSWYVHNIVAFANTEELNIAVLGANARKLFTTNRTEFAKGFVEQGSLCVLAWGYGITPTVSREKSKCLLAIGWGKILQIMILEDPDQGMSGVKFDGYYICDYPIDAVFFISDSILFILVNKKEIRILFIPHFPPGSFSYEGIRIKEAEDERQVQPNKMLANIYMSQGESQLRELSAKSELERGNTLLDGSIRYSITADKPNFSNVIASNENHLVVLGQEKILSAKLFYWEDYLVYIQKQCDWLVCLKIALDIYHGEAKGYYGVPYVKEDRENKLKHKMKCLIEDGIRAMIKNFNANNSDTSSSSSDYRADNIAIKAAVEFCYRINSFQFLFAGIIKLFAEEGLEEKFIENLEPFILSGYFKDEHLPDVILKKICDHYFNNEKYHSFERVVTKLNFSHYVFFNELETICKEKMLTTALIHLIITSLKSNDKQACSKILSNVFNRFSKAKKKALDNVKEMLLKDEESKFEIEASYEYIGLKLMYIIKLFIVGDKFPTGKLSPKIYPSFLSQSVEFMMKQNESLELLRLNSRSFFTVMTELYLNDYVASTLKSCSEPDTYSGNILLEFNHISIIDALKERLMLMQTEPYIGFEYSYFIIKVAGSKYCVEFAKDLANHIFHRLSHFLEQIVDYNSGKQTSEELNKSNKYVGPSCINMGTIESEIKSILPHYSKYMVDDQLDLLVEFCKKLKFDYIKIHLYEQLEKFDKCVDIFLSFKNNRNRDIFSWLHELNRVKGTKKELRIETLKEKILSVIEKLVTIDAESTGYVIDEWLPEKQREVIDHLQRKPDLQLGYLESYLKEREEDIIETQMASARNFSINKQSKDYKSLLELHVDLLAKHENRTLIEVVRKDYYPVDCLDRVKQNSSLLIKEAQAHVKKRAEMYVESLRLFLDLLKKIDAGTIEMELFSAKPEDDKGHVLSFNGIYNEIIDILIRSSNRPDATDAVWFDTLRALFRIKEKLTDGSSTKSGAIRGMIYARITEMMSLMSEYVDFEQVIDVLLEIDAQTTYEYCSKWFEGLYSSKNDQELLYTAAKRLLSNENSSLIDLIIQRNNVGFIGDRDKQVCSICDLNLGGFVNDPAFILTTCDHKFHSKCFFEDIKTRRILEGKKESDVKPECPICKIHHIEFDDKKKKSAKQGGKKRRGTKRKLKKQESSKSNEEDLPNESDDEMSAHPLMDKKAPIRTMEMYEKEYKSMDGEVYKQKLLAFDDDFAASQLSFTLD